MVSFEAREGSLSPLTSDQSLATSSEDFNSSTQSVILQDRQASTAIQVPLIDVSNENLRDTFYKICISLYRMIFQNSLKCLLYN